MHTVPKQLSMQEAAAHWARMTGTPRPHRGTLIRWATRGVRNCRLAAEPIAGRWYTTKQALEEFLQHVTQTSGAGDDAPPGAARTAQVARAMAELDLKTSARRGKEGAK